jgi:hypothetical protein
MQAPLPISEESLVANRYFRSAIFIAILSFHPVLSNWDPGRLRCLSSPSTSNILLHAMSRYLILGGLDTKQNTQVAETYSNQ